MSGYYVYSCTLPTYLPTHLMPTQANSLVIRYPCKKCDESLNYPTTIVLIPALARLIRVRPESRNPKIIIVPDTSILLKLEL